MQLMPCSSCEDRYGHLKNILTGWCRIWRVGGVIYRDLQNQDLRPIPLIQTHQLRKENVEDRDAKMEENHVKAHIRSVCESVVSLTQDLSHLVSVFLKPLMKLAEEPQDPTEQMLYKIRMCNEYNDLHGCIVGGFTIKPPSQISYCIESNMKRCLEMAEHAHMNFENINIHEVGLYLVMNVNAGILWEKGISEYLPVKDTRPQVDLVSRPLGTLREEHWKGWRKSIKKPNSEAERAMLLMALEYTLNILLQDSACFNKSFYSHVRGKDDLKTLELNLRKLYMVWWDGEVKRMLTKERINVQLYNRYAEDGVLVVTKLSEFGEKNPEKRTMERIRNICQKIDSSMAMSVDYPSNYANGRVPVMDTEQWIQEGATTKGGKKRPQILHSHYTRVISHKHFSDMTFDTPRIVKMNILTNDLVRIMRNVSHLCASTERISKVQEYLKLLTHYGYSQSERVNIYKRAKNKHDKMLDQLELELHQSKFWSYRKRKDKLNEKNGQRKLFSDVTVGTDQLQSRFFEDAALQNLAKQRYESIMKTFGYPIKVVERCSSSVRNELRKSNPFEATKCEGSNCKVCTDVLIKSLDAG